jgi:tRNA pseudouridine38-40 synthase
LTFYKLVIRYDGTNYYGWQKQPNQKTIQGEIEKVITQITKGSDFQVIGSGRTDTGVHALCQVVKVSVDSGIEAEQLHRALNSLLPDDIYVISLETVSENFQPVFDAKRKTYKYYFSISKDIYPTLRNQLTYLKIRDFDIDKAKDACRTFVGEHDFANYQNVGTPVKSTIREVFSFDIEKVDQAVNHIWPEDTYVISCTGNGFLKQMVRLMVAAVWSCAQSKITVTDIQESLKNPKSDKLAPTAPPQGLYLHEVVY